MNLLTTTSADWAPLLQHLAKSAFVGVPAYALSRLMREEYRQDPKHSNHGELVMQCLSQVLQVDEAHAADVVAANLAEPDDMELLSQRPDAEACLDDNDVQHVETYLKQRAADAEDQASLVRVGRDARLRARTKAAAKKRARSLAIPKKASLTPPAP